MTAQPITRNDQPQESDPIALAKAWLALETESGSPFPDALVLATARDNRPANRVVHLRELESPGPLFFTQRVSRKCHELLDNPQVAATLWLPLTTRQVRFEGEALPLSAEENAHYWSGLERKNQLHFTAYAPMSGQEIASRGQLRQRQQQLLEKFEGQEIPCPTDYVGFRLKPHTVLFYDFDAVDFSWAGCFEASREDWDFRILSP